MKNFSIIYVNTNNISSMIFNAKSEPAVSPVIGTILLVAIAVVLVAIILTVVMGFSGDTNEKKVGLNAKPESGGNATLILYGGASIDELVKLEMIDQDSPYGEYVKIWDITNGSAFVGIPYPAENVAQPETEMNVYDTRINVRGTFSDGTDLILLVQPMTFYDVARSVNAPVQPIVNIPEISGINYKAATATFTYENITPAAATCVIYCQFANGTGDKMEIISTKGTSVTSGSFSGTFANLQNGVEYNVWGEVITSDEQIITGKSAQFTTKTAIVSAPYVTSRKGSVTGIAFNYEDADSVSSAGFYYRPVGSTDEFIRASPSSATSSNGVGTRSLLIVLEQGADYEMYGYISGGSGNAEFSAKGPTEIITIGKTIVSAPYITKSSASSLTIRANYENANTYPTACILYYRPEGSIDEFLTHTLNRNGQNDGYVSGTVSLTPGTYEMYVSVGGGSGANVGSTPWSVAGPTALLTLS